jgi:hypothetical protein
MDSRFAKVSAGAAMLWAGLAVLSAAAEARIRPVVDDWYLCAEETARLERSRRIPDRLLTAISLVEAGRHHSKVGRTLAWPWTVMAEGRGRYLPSKAAAIREVERLQARGVSNIDVGCMQVNLYWHPDAFDSLAEAFDPARNVGFAASFLSGLHGELGAWDKAIANYHSRTPAYHVPYRRKVLAAWRLARRDTAPAYQVPNNKAGPAPGPVVAALPRQNVLTHSITPSRQVLINRNDPGSVAWRQARPGASRGAQIILRKSTREIVLKPGRSWAGRRTPVLGAIDSSAPGS